MSPGAKQTLVIAGFGGTLLLLLWLRNRGEETNVLPNNQVSFPVPAMVSPLQSPLFSIPYAAAPTGVDTRRSILPTPLQSIQPRDNSSADNAGCCDKCETQPITFPVVVYDPVVSSPSKPNIPSAAEFSSNIGKKIIPASVTKPIATPTKYSDARVSNDFTQILNQQFTSIAGLRGMIH